MVTPSEVFTWYVVRPATAQRAAVTAVLDRARQVRCADEYVGDDGALRVRVGWNVPVGAAAVDASGSVRAGAA